MQCNRFKAIDLVTCSFRLDDIYTSILTSGFGLSHRSTDEEERRQNLRGHDADVKDGRLHQTETLLTN